MPEDNQTLIPRSFIDLFVPAGRIKPTEPRDVIARRYDLCEDLAQMLTEAARARLFELGITENEVLERVHRGLLADAAVVNATEARWVLFRLAELLDWPAPDWLDPV
jgi:Fe2+ transport system protein FeoA